MGLEHFQPTLLKHLIKTWSVITLLIALIMLIAKFYAYGLDLNSLKLIHRQKSRINNPLSKVHEIDHGVPHGWTIGPLFQYSYLQIVLQRRGETQGLACPFLKNENKYPNFGKKCTVGIHLWVKCLAWNAVLRASRMRSFLGVL